MNREILFRGKPKTDYWFFSQIWVDSCKDGFVYGSLLVSKDKYYICVSAICAINQCVSNGTTSMIEVDPSTVGQYTGLTDKNGKRIFEGDIVEYVSVGWDDPEMTRAEVIWCGCDGGWGTTEGQDYCPDALTAPDAERMTVIGNIHDNPELMNSEGTTRNGG